MPDIPRYPTEGGRAGHEAGQRPTRSWRTYVLIAAGIALVVLFVALHLTGVLGPGEH